ncbi:hypothetical protein PLICRDRAFT_511200 [Plicaturopsis crispa FD-325 SS-3]|nr:hypothetical protein PLICRDRAFT_511200 [Plicaturopsis crispa FD-325 SS-3]
MLYFTLDAASPSCTGDDGHDAYLSVRLFCRLTVVVSVIRIPYLLCSLPFNMLSFAFVPSASAQSLSLARSTQRVLVCRRSYTLILGATRTRIHGPDAARRPPSKSLRAAGSHRTAIPPWLGCYPCLQRTNELAGPSSVVCKALFADPTGEVEQNPNKTRCAATSIYRSCMSICDRPNSFSVYPCVI